MNVEGLTRKNRGAKSVWYENDSGEIAAKRCTKCREVKPLIGFENQKGGLAGKLPSCRVCRKRYRKEHERSATRRSFLKSEAAAGLSRVVSKSSGGCAVYLDGKGNVIYRECSKCTTVKKTRDFYASTSGYMGLQAQCKECMNRVVYSWVDNNPEKTLAAMHRRRDRKAALPNDFTADQHADMYAHFNGACALTGETDNIHIDHAVALATGRGGTTVGNMVPLSATLNTSKNDRHLFEWFDANKERFGLEQARFDRMIEYLAHRNGMTPAEYRSYVDECYANKSAVS